MKNIIGLLFVLLFVLLLAIPVLAQEVPVIYNASSLMWEHGGGATYRLYVLDTPGIVPDGLTFTEVIAREWPIRGLATGEIYYAVVTAYYGTRTPPIETPPSNEVTFEVLEIPALRISDAFIGVAEFDLEPDKIAFFLTGFSED